MPRKLRPLMLVVDFARMCDDKARLESRARARNPACAHGALLACNSARKFVKRPRQRQFLNSMTVARRREC